MDAQDLREQYKDENDGKPFFQVHAGVFNYTTGYVGWLEEKLCAMSQAQTPSTLGNVNENRPANGSVVTELPPDIVIDFRVLSVKHHSNFKDREQFVMGCVATFIEDILRNSTKQISKERADNEER